MSNLSAKYAIEFPENIDKDLEKIPTLIVEKIKEKIKKILCIDPFQCEQLHGKGLNHFRKLKYSSYRCIFYIENKTVKIVYIGIRKDCYDILKNK